jgi:general secretion pathway protein J
MMLLAILSAAILAAAHYGTSAWHATEASASQDNRMLLIQSELQQALERAYPKFTATTETDGHVEFDGNADGFTVLAPESTNPGHLLRLTIGSARDGDALALVETNVPELAVDALRTHTRVLLRGIAAVEFSYYGGNNPQSAPAWYPHWQGRTTPPQLVRLRVLFAGQSARQWPNLIVAPKITVDIKCSFDTLTTNCQGI